MPLLEETFLTTFAVPFIFILAVVYGSLHMSGVIKNKAANGLIALSIAFFAATNADVIIFANSILPLAIPFFILFFFVGFIISFFKKQEAQKDYPLLVIIFGLGLIFVAFVQRESELLTETTAAAAGIIFMLLLFFAAYKASKEQ